MLGSLRRVPVSVPDSGMSAMCLRPPVFCCARRHVPLPQNQSTRPRPFRTDPTLHVLAAFVQGELGHVHTGRAARAHTLSLSYPSLDCFTTARPYAPPLLSLSFPLFPSLLSLSLSLSLARPPLPSPTLPLPAQAGPLRPFGIAKALHSEFSPYDVWRSSTKKALRTFFSRSG